MESQLAPGPDYEDPLTIDDRVVECDLDQYNVTKLEIINDGAVIGEVEADGDIDIRGGATYEGDVHSTNSGSITMTDSTTLGAVATGGDVDVDGSTVQNHVYEDNGFSCDSSEINGQNCGSYTPEDYGDY